jgi:hypothetical protein
MIQMTQITQITRHLALLTALIATGAAFLTGGAAGCGRNIPDVAGTYNLTDTECPGFFAETVEITQSGDVITFDPPGLSGSIDINGDFNVSNGDITCVGSFSEGTATATCTGDEIGECGITYEKQ